MARDIDDMFFKEMVMKDRREIESKKTVDDK